ncbi:MAG: haloacid dehalogenase [Anaerolineae bacterium]|nr:haloacid dehalogenase [Anaerolineae bacterium]
MPDSRLMEIGERIRESLVAKNAARDKAVNLSRELIRYCSLAIRASHRNEWQATERLLSEAHRAADELQAIVKPYPDLLFSGYTQDALKELAEAHIALAIAQDKPIPAPEEIGVEYATYLNGLAEAVGELRRRVLDEIRTGHSQEAERLLAAMDEIYDLLVTMDFPEAITGGLRRSTDMVRGVLERTRSDLTVSFRESELMAAIERLQDGLKAFNR